MERNYYTEDKQKLLPIRIKHINLTKDILAAQRLGITYEEIIVFLQTREHEYKDIMKE